MASVFSACHDWETPSYEWYFIEGRTFGNLAKPPILERTFQISVIKHTYYFLRRPIDKCFIHIYMIILIAL
jgi:hypothetical protein